MTHRRRLTAMVVALSMAAALSACSDEDPDEDPGQDGPDTPATSTAATAEFPVSVEHKYGTTTVPEEPNRIVTIGYNDQDAVLALGVSPVASTSWFEEKVVYPWSEDALEAAGGSEPEIISASALESDGLERVAAFEPDLIVGVFSYLTQEQYDEYSQIAPVLVGSADYPNDGTPWQEQTLMVGQALGREDVATEVVAEAEAAIAEIGARNPEFAGATAVSGAGVFDGQAALYPSGRDGSVYEGGAYAAGYLLPALGFEIPEEIDAYGDEVTTPLISFELIDLLDQDVALWTFPRDSDSGKTLNQVPTYTSLAVSQEGRDVYTDDLVATAVNFSTVLSLPWVAEQIEPQLVAALDGDPATSTDPS